VVTREVQNGSRRCRRAGSRGHGGYKRFREFSRELVRTSEQLGNLRLQQAGEDEAVKKTALAASFGAELQQEIELWCRRRSVEQLDLRRWKWLPNVRRCNLRLE
jgi:hypothetical protein